MRVWDGQNKSLFPTTLGPPVHQTLGNYPPKKNCRSVIGRDARRRRTKWEPAADEGDAAAKEAPVTDKWEMLRNHHRMDLERSFIFIENRVKTSQRACYG